MSCTSWAVRSRSPPLKVEGEEALALGMEDGGEAGNEGTQAAHPHKRRLVFGFVLVRRPALPFLSMSGLEGGLERSASDVHHTLCALVSTNAATQPAWADYAALMLSAETAAFFEARLPDAKAAAVVDGESNAKPQPPKKKRKRNAASDDGDESDVDVKAICEHCGGVVPEVSLRVASLDGTTLELTVPQRGLVREVKRMVGQVRGRLAMETPS